MSADMLDMQFALTRKGGFRLAVDGRIPLSGITAISGPSGSGKTTLLRALAGLEILRGAEIRLGDTVWNDAGTCLAPEERRVGFVFQDAALFPHLTVADNIGYGARRRGVTNYAAILEALDLPDLLKRPVPGLSGGEARRVALARALASDPAILFLDEPLSGLDQARKDELLPYIGRAVAEAQVPALYVTHSRAEVAALADRVLGLENGQLSGWQPAPIRLRAQVIETVGEQARVKLLGAPETEVAARLMVPRIAELGEIVGLGIRQESLIVSSASPGRSDAVLQVPAEITEGENGPVLEIFGQKIALPARAPQIVGSQVWLSVAEVSPRPEASDSV